MRGAFRDHREALVEAEHALLVRVDQHSHDDFVELGGRALEDVDVAEGDRIEGTRAYGATHGQRRYRAVQVRSPSSSLVSPYVRDGHACQPSGHVSVGPCVGRSMTATVPLPVHPPCVSAASTDSTSPASTS